MNTIMEPYFNDDETQYLFFLTTFYTDITSESLAKTFNYWYGRTISPVIIRNLRQTAFARAQQPSVMSWALNSFHSEEVNHRFRLLATYRMMYDLFEGHTRAIYRIDRSESVANLIQAGFFQLE
ncbi:MAG: hypothetical protein Q9226_002872 [Calogaya cf. arnoldii]